MDPSIRGLSPPRVHFHIRWSGTAGLDFSPFDSHAEAEEAAKQLVRHNETYSIEPFDGSCEKCADTIGRFRDRSGERRSKGA